MTMCDCNQGRLPCTCKPAQQQPGEPVALPARLPAHRASAYGWNACLDEIAKLGPLYTRPVQGEPVAEVVATGGPHDREDRVLVELQAELPPIGTKLYTHADPAEVERLRDELDGYKQGSRIEAEEADTLRVERDTLIRALETADSEVNTLRAQLAEAHALLREVDTSGPIGPYPNSLQARIKSALESKP